MPGSAAPCVLVSRSALEHNARALFAEGGVADLRHDAYGHGLDEAAAVVTAAGAVSVIVDGPDEVERLAAAGIPARAEGEPTAGPAGLFGIPQAGDPAPSAPVMRLEGRVLSTKPLLTGEAVSYGYTHRAPRDTRVALVTGGYAQGILRALGNRVPVQIGAQTHPIVGRIAMDVCVVDLDGADVLPGAAVRYFGGEGPVRHALALWSSVTGLSALEMAVVVGRNGERTWTA